MAATVAGVSHDAAARWWEDAAISLGMVAVQLAGAAYMVVLTPILALGLDPLFLVTFGSLSTGIFTLPFALNLDRNKWPSELSNRLILELVVLSLGGVTVFQALMLDGMKKTSPAIASAMLNLAPGFIFVVAGCLRNGESYLKELLLHAVDGDPDASPVVKVHVRCLGHLVPLMFHLDRDGGARIEGGR